MLLWGHDVPVCSDICYHTKCCCRGVICLVEVIDGRVVKGDRVSGVASGETYDVNEVQSDLISRTALKNSRGFRH